MKFFSSSKFGLNLSLFLLFCLPLSPLTAKAAGLVPCGGPDEPECTACHLLVLVQNVIHFALEAVFIVCICLIIYGGFRWLFSFGKQENIAAGQKIITSALIGLMIVLASWLIVNTIFWIIAMLGGEDYTGTWWQLKCL